MKTLLTIIDPVIAPHCVEFRANHYEYAVRNGYEYVVGDTLHWPDLPASFSKIGYICEALRNPKNEVVIWADADVAFTRMNVDIGDLLKPDYWLAGYDQQNKEWIGQRPYLCAGLMIVRNDQRARDFFDEVYRRCESRAVTTHPFEQWYVDELLVAMKWAGVKLCTTAEIGGFSREYWNDGASVMWYPGVPTVHISTSGDWEGRRKTLIEKYLPEIRR